MKLNQAYKILREAGFHPDQYRWLKVPALFAWARRVEREGKKVIGKGHHDRTCGEQSDVLPKGSYLFA